MSTSTAELTLIIRAQNLADAELAKVKTSLQGMATTAGTVAQSIADHFRGIGRRIGNQFGNLAVDILSGGRIEDNLRNLGALMAGAIIEGLVASLVPKMLAKIAATEVFIQVSAAFAAGGVTAGTAFDAAVAVTMAALPFVILAAAVAALVFLIVNPEARQRAHDAGAMIVAKIGEALSVLGKVLFDWFQRGWGVAVQAIKVGLAQVPALFGAAFQAALVKVRDIIGKIVDIILTIPRAVAKALGALKQLPAGLGQGGNFMGLPIPAFDSGGMVPGPLGFPQLAVVHGGEEVRTRAQQAQGGFTIQGVSERQIIDMVDRGLYFRLQRAAPTIGRT